MTREISVATKAIVSELAKAVSRLSLLKSFS